MKRRNQALEAEVQRLIASMHRPNDIARQCAKRFHVSERNVHQYMKRYWDEMAALDSETTKARRKTQLHTTLTRVMETALAKGETKHVIDVIDRIAKLHGLYAPEVVEITGKVGPMAIALTSQRARGRIVELAAKARELGSQARLGIANGQVIDVGRTVPDDDMSDVADALRDREAGIDAEDVDSKALIDDDEDDEDDD